MKCPGCGGNSYVHCPKCEAEGQPSCMLSDLPLELWQMQEYCSQRCKDNTIALLFETSLRCELDDARETIKLLHNILSPLNLDLRDIVNYYDAKTNEDL